MIAGGSLRAAVDAAAGYIAAHQRPDGSIAWFDGGVVDPWDQVECAMALDVGGRTREAERAYRWLAEAQHGDGSVWASFRDGEPADRTKDSNLSSYVSVGVWHHYMATGDRAFLRELWPVVERAVEFALALQADHGGVYWARDEHDNVWDDCLVAGSSSVRAAIVCAERAAGELGERGGDRWRPPRLALEAALREPDGAFGWSWEDDKAHFAMDWYYPVLCGVLSGERAQRHLDAQRERFVRAGRGCRCRDDQPWVTVAESCELALALDACGRREQARELLGWQLMHQERDGGFRTGTVPGYGPWPDGERPTWTAAAAVLAADAVERLTPAGGLFRSLQAS